jgi:HEPN domain-containing protein
MNRADLQRISEQRLRESKILLDAEAYPGAFYLAGYAVECALKSCIAKKFKEHDFPDKDFVNGIYSHKLDQLLKHAGLDGEPEITMGSKSRLWEYWSYVKTWNETKRYEEPTRKEAEELYLAIADPSDGVLQWLKIRC